MGNKKSNWTRLIYILYLSFLFIQCNDSEHAELISEDSSQTMNVGVSGGTSSSKGDTSFIFVNVEEQENIALTSSEITFQASLYCGDNESYVLNQGHNQVNTKSQACCIILNRLSIGEDLLDANPAIGSAILLAKKESFEPDRYVRIDKNFSRPELNTCNANKDNKVASQSGDAFNFIFLL